MGFSYESSTPSSCYEQPAGLTVSSFINRQPICTWSTDANKNIVLLVSNLRTTGTSAPNFYGVQVSGLKTGPSARSSSMTGKTPSSAYVTTYDGSKELYQIQAIDFVIAPMTKTDGVTLVGSPDQNSVSGELTISFNVAHPVPASGSFTIAFPLQNRQYQGLGIAPTRQMIDTGKLSINGKYTSSSQSKNLGTLTYKTKSEFELDYVYINLKNSDVIAAGSVLTITMEKVMMPPTFKPLDNFIVYTGDSEFFQVEVADYMTLTNTIPGDENSVAGFVSTAQIKTLTGVYEKDQTYGFEVFLTGDIPMNGFFTLKIPAIVGVPSSISSMTMECEQSCEARDITLTWNAGTRTISFQGLVPEESRYIMAPGPLSFSLKGFTNPSTADVATFVFTSYAILDSGEYMIDQISSMKIQAEQGKCQITKVEPSDGNYMIYGVAKSWSFTMRCDHAVTKTQGIRITFAKDFYVISSTSCILGGLGTSYSCTAVSDSGSITVKRFLKNDLKAKEAFSFTINSVRNPSVTGTNTNVDVEILSDSGGAVDLGTWTIDNKKFVKGEILKYTVTPQNYGVGAYPVFYDFEIQPSGEFYAKSYIVIRLPTQVKIHTEREIEKQCSYKLVGFTATRINCQVSSSTITIQQGFPFKGTTAMTENDSMIPPTIKFSLPQFLNPRSMSVSSEFGLSIYSSTDQEIYSWNPAKVVTLNGKVSTAVTKGPVIQMSTAAKPQGIIISQGSKQNGAITNYNVTVRTTNYVVEGDIVDIKMPYPVFLSSTTNCLGMSRNLRLNQTYTVSADLSSIQISLKLALGSVRKLQGSTQVINSGESFTLQLTDVKNPPSHSPTVGSIQYSISSGSFLVEQQTEDLIIVNTEPGEIEEAQVEIRPLDFRQSMATNYTLAFKPANYLQNMQIVLTLPPQIRFGSNQVKCYGAQGTDSELLKCDTNIRNRTVTVTNAVTYQKGNPGTIKIVFDSFKNPDKNIITSRWGLNTMTSDGFMLDNLFANITIDFFCAYPCATCDKANNTQCLSCYFDDQFSIFHESGCFQTCPEGFIYNQVTDSCSICNPACGSCTESATDCATCKEGFILYQGKCEEFVYYPFPFIALALLQFCCVCCSEICTRTKSKFKEAFIALLSLPEVGSWCSFLVFLFLRDGWFGTFLFGAAALAFYILLNWIHMCILPNKIIPQSPQSYRLMLTHYPHSSRCVRCISCLVSFKFSIILISYFCMRPRFRGDYNDSNLQHFNRLSLVFILIPYPVMTFACGSFLFLNGIFSYTGFAAMEVIAISSFMTLLQFMDAISTCKCRATNKQLVKPDHGADYESEDETKLKRRKRGESDDEQRGNDHDESHQNFIENEALRSQYSATNREETNRQVAILEELAKQMREEKEMLRLERERIQRERMLMDDEAKQSTQFIRQEQYHDDKYGPDQRVQHGPEQRGQEYYQRYSPINQRVKKYMNVEDEMDGDVEEPAPIVSLNIPEPINVGQNVDQDFTQEVEQQNIHIQMPTPVSEYLLDNQESDLELICIEELTPVAGQINYNQEFDTEQQEDQPEHLSQESINQRLPQSAQSQQPYEQEQVSLKQELGGNQPYFEEFDDVISRQASEMVFMEFESAEKGLTAKPKSVWEGHQSHDEIFMEPPQSAAKGMTGKPVSIWGGTQEFGDILLELGSQKSEPLSKRASAISKEATEQNFIQQPETAERGMTGKPVSIWEGSRDFENDSQIVPSDQNANKQMVFEDESGASESSEAIVDHAPFSTAFQVNQFRQPKQNKIADDLNADIAVASRNQSQTKAQTHQVALQSSKSPVIGKKPIIYSDKSESSIDEMMGDTPSNYNIANGRIDGKSLGLKAMFQQANKTKLEAVKEEEERKQVRAPNLDQSFDVAWGAINAPIQTTKRVNVIDEPSGDETVGQVQRHKKKAIKTNKQFSETPSVSQLGGRLVVGRSQQVAKGGTIQDLVQNQVRKNNYL